MPGAMLIVVVGQEEVVLRLRDVAARRVRRLAVAGERRRRARGRSGSRTSDDLQQVGVRVDVDDLAEPRVRSRAVVALEEVLHRDLPVRPRSATRGGSGSGPRRRRGRSARRGRGGSPSASSSGAASGSGLTKTNGPHVSTETGASERPDGVEAGLAFGAWRAAQRSRRGRTSTRGTGTGASRGSPRRSTTGGRGAGRR